LGTIRVIGSADWAKLTAKLYLGFGDIGYPILKGETALWNAMRSSSELFSDGSAMV
jgi:hypothetical protein